MTTTNINWLASFDIGKKNFAFYIEEIDKEMFNNITRIPKTKRYNPDGTPTLIFDEILDKVCKNGKTILFENIDLTIGSNKDLYLDTEIFHNMTDVLDKYSDFWDKCEAFVIEKQMSFGKKYNTMALKLGQHCWSYFSFRYGRFKEIVEFPAYNKTQILGACKDVTTHKGKNVYKAISKPARKKWSIKKALYIFNLRNDIETLNIMKKSKKKDDLADVLCQLQAFKILVYVDKSL